MKLVTPSFSIEGLSAPVQKSQTPPVASPPLQSGRGGLQDREIAVGQGSQESAPHQLRVDDKVLDEALQLLKTHFEPSKPASAANPYDDGSLFFEEQAAFLNRDTALFRDLKDAHAKRQGAGAAGVELRNGLLRNLEKQVATNKTLPVEEAGLPSVSSAQRDDFFQAARALSEHAKGRPVDWLLVQSRIKLDEAIVALARLEASVQDPKLPEEQKSGLRLQIKGIKAGITSWEFRLAALTARREAAPVGETPADAGDGVRRTETLGVASRAKRAFFALFSPLAQALSRLGTHLASLPTRLWAGITGALSAGGTGPRPEKMGDAALNKFFTKFVGTPPEAREMQDDRKPAGAVGNLRYICKGMVKDLTRGVYFIGGQRFVFEYVAGEPDEDTRIRRAAHSEMVATALLKECGGNTQLCMSASYYAFQNMLSFPYKAVRNGDLKPDGFDGTIKGLEQPTIRSFSMAHLDDAHIHLLFQISNPRLTWFSDEDEEVIELDPSASAFSCRYAIAVAADGSATPYPIEPASGDSSAVAYSLYVAPVVN